MHSHAMPKVPTAGNYSASLHRRRVVKGYADQHPVTAMSRAADEWLHRPFDVAELAHNFSDLGEAYV